MIKPVRKESIRNLSYYESKSHFYTFGYTLKGWGENDLINLFADRKVLLLNQVHQQKIVSFSDRLFKPEADGIVVSAPFRVAVIKTADCLPLFFFSTSVRLAGIVHCGWRGIVAGIVDNLMKLLESRDKLANIFFILGAAIEWQCYEIKDDVQAEFERKFSKQKATEIIRKNDHKLFLDLKEAVRTILTENKISREQIFNIGSCTYCNPELPSFRRTKSGTDRIYNYIYINE